MWKWIPWIIITIRAIRNWRRLRKEGKEALVATKLALIATRRALLADAHGNEGKSIYVFTATQAFTQAIDELGDVIALVEEILG